MDIDDHKYRPKRGNTTQRNQLLAFIVLATFLVSAFLVSTETGSSPPTVLDAPLRDAIHNPTDVLTRMESAVVSDVVGFVGANTRPVPSPKLDADGAWAARPTKPTPQPHDGKAKADKADKEDKEDKEEVGAMLRELSNTDQRIREAEAKAATKAAAMATENDELKRKLDEAERTIARLRQHAGANTNNNDGSNNGGKPVGGGRKAVPAPQPPPAASRPQPSDMRGPVAAVRYDVAAHSQRPIDDTTRQRQAAVKEAMQHAWGSYKKYAWGQDELRPVSRHATNDFGMGLTIVDALDTLWIMDLQDDFNDGAAWVRDNLAFDYSGNISVFETMIRVVGGLLSAYELSADTVFLDKVRALVDKLKHAFDSPSGIPYSTLNLNSFHTANYGWTGQAAVTAEGGSVQLEMRSLSRFTGDNEYARLGDRAFFALEATPNKPHKGLYPLYVTNSSPHKFTTGQVSLGAMGDSFYEYMLKLHLQTNGADTRFRKMYEESMEGALEHLLMHSDDGFDYFGELNGRSKVHVMEHLTCFAGGMLALGAKYLPELANAEQHTETGKAIGRTCYLGYANMPLGIAPEAWRFDGGMHPDRRKYYLLRPETVETLFYLYRLTGESKYQDWGWEIFQNIEKVARVEGGYSGLHDVTVSPPKHNDKMESFFLAETLKYLYLLFSPTDLISLDDFVFNTEAHPLRRFTIE